MSRFSLLLASLSLLLVAPTDASAHKPSYGGVDVFGSPEEAYIVEDFDTSIVVYHEVTCRSEQLWLEYDALGGDSPLYIQLGVPVIDRLETYRPSIAVVAPGLPDDGAELPFALPEGMGAFVIDTAALVDPADFYEPFSQTDSWILHEQTIEVPEGIGYVVAWHPQRETGKLWVATGTVEDFGPSDFGQMGDWMTLTKTFHEVAPYEPLEVPVETVCEDPGLDLPAQADDLPVGCNTTGAGASPWTLLILLTWTWLGGRRRPGRRMER